MIRVEGDFHITVNSAIDYGHYSNGNPGVKFTVGLAPHVQDLLRRLEIMEREWQATKTLIDSNPAVRASYEQFQQVCALAKDFG